MTPACTLIVPTFKGKFTEARGFARVVTEKLPDICRLPSPETSQISCTCNCSRSAIVPGTTKLEIIRPVAAPNSGASASNGKAFQNPKVMLLLASNPKVRLLTGTLTSAASEPLTDRPT